MMIYRTTICYVRGSELCETQYYNILLGNGVQGAVFSLFDAMDWITATTHFGCQFWLVAYCLIPKRKSVFQRQGLASLTLVLVPVFQGKSKFHWLRNVSNAINDSLHPLESEKSSFFPKQWTSALSSTALLGWEPASGWSPLAISEHWLCAQTVWYALHPRGSDELGVCQRRTLLCSCWGRAFCTHRNLSSLVKKASPGKVSPKRFLPTSWLGFFGHAHMTVVNQ